MVFLWAWREGRGPPPANEEDSFGLGRGRIFLIPTRIRLRQKAQRHGGD
jgi:hypothetical protein